MKVSGTQLRKTVLHCATLTLITLVHGSRQCGHFTFPDLKSDLKITEMEHSEFVLLFTLDMNECQHSQNKDVYVTVYQPPNIRGRRRGFCTIRMHDKCTTPTGAKCDCVGNDKYSFVFKKNVTIADTGVWLWQTGVGNVSAEVNFHILVGKQLMTGDPIFRTSEFTSTPTEASMTLGTSQKPSIFRIIEVRRIQVKSTWKDDNRFQSRFEAACTDAGTLSCHVPVTRTSGTPDPVVFRYAPEVTDLSGGENSTNITTEMSVNVEKHTITLPATCSWESRRPASSKSGNRFVQQTINVGNYTMQSVLYSDCEGAEHIKCFVHDGAGNDTKEQLVPCHIKNVTIQYQNGHSVKEEFNITLLIVTVAVPAAAVVVLLCIALLVFRLKRKKSVGLHMGTTGMPAVLPPPPVLHRVRLRPLDSVVFRRDPPTLELNRDSFGSVHTHLYTDIDDAHLFSHTSVNCQVSSDSHDADKPVARILPGIVSRPSDSSSSGEYAVAYGCSGVVGTNMPAQNRSPASSSDSDGYLKPTTSCSKASSAPGTRTLPKVRKTSANPQRTFAPVTSAKRDICFGKSSDYLNPVSCLSEDATVWTTSDTSLEAATATLSDREAATFPRATPVTCHTALGTSTEPWLKSTPKDIAQRGTVASATTDLLETSLDSETGVAMATPTESASALTLQGTIIAALKAAAAELSGSQAADKKSPVVSVKTMYTGEQGAPSCVTCRTGPSNT